MFYTEWSSYNTTSIRRIFLIRTFFNFQTRTESVLFQKNITIVTIDYCRVNSILLAFDRFLKLRTRAFALFEIKRLGNVRPGAASRNRRNSRRSYELLVLRTYFCLRFRARPKCIKISAKRETPSRPSSRHTGGDRPHERAVRLPAYPSTYAGPVLPAKRDRAPRPYPKGFRSFCVKRFNYELKGVLAIHPINVCTQKIVAVVWRFTPNL